MKLCLVPDVLTGVNPVTAQVYLLMASRTNEYGVSCLSQGEIAKALNISERTAKRCTGELEALGVVRHAGRGRWETVVGMLHSQKREGRYRRREGEKGDTSDPFQEKGDTSDPLQVDGKKDNTLNELGINNANILAAGHPCHLSGEKVPPMSPFMLSAELGMALNLKKVVQSFDPGAPPAEQKKDTEKKWMHRAAGGQFAARETELDILPVERWTVGNFASYWRHRYYQLYPSEGRVPADVLIGRKGFGQLKKLLGRLGDSRMMAEDSLADARRKLRAMMDHFFNNAPRIMAGLGLTGRAFPGVLVGWQASIEEDMHGTKRISPRVATAAEDAPGGDSDDHGFGSVEDFLNDE